MNSSGTQAGICFSIKAHIPSRGSGDSSKRPGHRLVVDETVPLSARPLHMHPCRRRPPDPADGQRRGLPQAGHAEIAQYSSSRRRWAAMPSSCADPDNCYLIITVRDGSARGRREGRRRMRTARGAPDGVTTCWLKYPCQTGKVWVRPVAGHPGPDGGRPMPHLGADRVGRLLRPIYRHLMQSPISFLLSAGSGGRDVASSGPPSGRQCRDGTRHQTRLRCRW